MLKKIYSKNNDKDVVKFSGLTTLKDLMIMVIPETTKIKWIGEKKKYKCIARNDDYIIVVKPYNLQKDFNGNPLVQYSILDLKIMCCNKDNLIFGVYNYSDKEDCERALEQLDNRDLEISKRGIVKIEDVIEEIWIEMKTSKEGE